MRRTKLGKALCLRAGSSGCKVKSVMFRESTVLFEEMIERIAYDKSIQFEAQEFLRLLKLLVVIDVCRCAGRQD